MKVQIRGLELILQAETLGEASTVSELYAKYSSKKLSIGHVNAETYIKNGKTRKVSKPYKKDRRLFKCLACDRIFKGAIGNGRHMDSNPDHKRAGSAVVQDEYGNPVNADTSSDTAETGASITKVF